MLEGKSILLGVSGGIAAYKAAELVRCLVKEQATVQVVMTAAAQQFITPLTLQALSGQPVCTDLFDLGLESRIGHIQVARAAHLAVLAPATANLMAKMAAGIADDYLTTVILATTAPVLICPAMNDKMYAHPATRRNLQTLRTLGYHILEPEFGSLACGEEGPGRLVDLPKIVEAARRLLTPPSLQGRRILVSAGPTWEGLDPVRFVTNPSTGKMGYALASVAARRSAEVHLVTGPCSLGTPQDIHVHRVTSAEEMKQAVLALAPGMDAIVMAAAVGDYRPQQVAAQKLKKAAPTMEVTLVRNPDILLLLGENKPPAQVLVGFAAETENLIENAREKLVKKNLDFIVANDLSVAGSGFASDTNQVKIVDRSGEVAELPCLPKEQVAAIILDRVEQLLAMESREIS
jgi:phosphopantothenoylcysteine decarboxylase / phosphopantothenate---cysteine ligase